MQLTWSVLPGFQQPVEEKLSLRNCEVVYEIGLGGNEFFLWLKFNM